MAVEKITPRQEQRGLGYAPSISPAPMVAPSQLMAPPSIGASQPSNTNELMQVSEALSEMNTQLKSYGTTYVRESARAAQEAAVTDAGADPAKAERVLRMGMNEAVKQGLVKEGANPQYWRFYMQTAADNAVADKYRGLLYSEKYLNKASDPKNTNPVASLFQESRGEFLKDFNLDSVFAKAAANKSMAEVEKAFSTTALSQRIRNRQNATENEYGMGGQRLLKTFQNDNFAEGSDKASELSTQVVAYIDNAYKSGVQDPSGKFVKGALAPVINEMAAVNPDKALAFLHTVKNTRLPTGATIGEGDALDAFNTLEDRVLSIQRTYSNRNSQERSIVLQGAEDQIENIINGTPNLSDPDAAEVVYNQLIGGKIVIPDPATGKLQEVPMAGYEHLFGRLRSHITERVNQANQANFKADPKFYERFQVAVAQGDFFTARELYGQGVEGALLGEKQAEALAALQNLEGYKGAMQSESVNNQRGTLKSILAADFRTADQSVRDEAVSSVDVEFNSIFKQTMDEARKASPNQTLDQLVPAAAKQAFDLANKRIRERTDKLQKAFELGAQRKAELETKRAQLADPKAWEGPSLFNFNSVDRLKKNISKVDGIVYNASKSKVSLSAGEQEEIRAQRERNDMKLREMINEASNQLDRPFKVVTEQVSTNEVPGQGAVIDEVPMGDPRAANMISTPSFQREVLVSPQEKEIRRAKYYELKAIQGYSMAEIVTGNTDEGQATPQELNPLTTRMFSSKAELDKAIREGKTEGSHLQQMFTKLKITDATQFIEAQRMLSLSRE
jgi:hypothetical protein